MTTLIGTSPNILIAGALDDHGLRSFSMFDFTPVGLAALSVGVVYMALWGRKLLPERDPGRESGLSRPGGPARRRCYQSSARARALAAVTSSCAGRHSTPTKPL